MDWDYTDYLSFIDSILLFRGVRDSDDAPEIWMDRWLDNIERNKDNSPEVRRHLVLAAKMAELIDGRKQWLLDEVDEELRKAFEKTPQAA